MEPLRRLRLNFIGGKILSKSQKLDGLKRSWVLLKPQSETVSDVAFDILHAFELYNSCPNGLILSMDGFVLPPSQPLNILKNGDLICVKRRQVNLSDVIKEHGLPNTLVDKIIDKQPTCMKLLGNESAKEKGGYDSDTEVEEDERSDRSHQRTEVEVNQECNGLQEETVPNGNAILKKRKASKELKSSKKKKPRKSSPEHEEVSPQTKEISGPLGSPGQERKSSKNRNVEDGKPAPEVSRKDPKKKGLGSLVSSDVPGKPGQDSNHSKLQVSRSTRRKWAKRVWLRTVKLGSTKKKNCKINQPEEETESGKDIVPVTNVGSTKENNCKINPPEVEVESEEEIVPVTIRPGHIRFAPSGKEKEVEQSMLEQETYQWKGVLGKRKGQKWGQNKQQYQGPKFNEVTQDEDFGNEQHLWAHDKNSTQDLNGWEKPCASEQNGWGKQKTSSKWNEYKTPQKNFSNRHANWKATPANKPLDFEKLVPLTDNPVEGDTIAYRLLVLSSSFCPELSSYRVGKVSSFDPKSNMVLLVPVPEYPFDFEKKSDTDENVSEELPNSASAHYNDDGSLEIDFPSLADVRIVKLQNLNMVAAGQMGNATPVTKNTSSWTAVTGQTSSSLEPVSNSSVDNSSGPVNGKKDVWEEISEALSAKKAQLQGTKWIKKKSSSIQPSSWSRRTLQGSALGPTMALLRAENGV